MTDSSAQISPPFVGAVRIGTRGSALARWQSEWVAARLKALHPGCEIELIEIKTQGDNDRQSPLSAIGGQGLFTKEIQRALLDRRVEIAVHSLKDLPTASPAELLLAAVPAREDEADALIAPRHGRLEDLPQGATIGTGSLRRRAQLLHLRSDLNIVGIRGNVETRLRQAVDGGLDGVVLAEAGLKRLGLESHVTDRLSPPRFLPAVGQGALGIECRADDVRTRELLAGLNDATVMSAVRAERRVLAELEGGCMIPLAAWGRLENDILRLTAAVFGCDGRDVCRAEATGLPDDPDALGREIAEILRRQGAERLLGRE